MRLGILHNRLVESLPGVQFNDPTHAQPHRQPAPLRCPSESGSGFPVAAAGSPRGPSGYRQTAGRRPWAWWPMTRPPDSKAISTGLIRRRSCSVPFRALAREHAGVRGGPGPDGRETERVLPLPSTNRNSVSTSAGNFVAAGIRLEHHGLPGGRPGSGQTTGAITPLPHPSAELVRVTYCTDCACWDEAQFGGLVGRSGQCRRGLRGQRAPAGWSCGGGWMGVLFSKSPRGRPAEMLGTGGGQSPKIFKPGSGWRFVRCGFGWGRFGCWCGPGSGICVGGWNRVSLKSCSGAILDWMSRGGAGCVCCLRTQ
ncbi:hypothetical protein ACVWZ8_001866 [Arthrobacter sp. UYCu723]